MMYVQSCCFVNLRPCPHYCVFESMRFVFIDNTSIDLRPIYRFDAFLTVHIRDFKIQRLGWQRQRKKINGFNKQRQQLCPCITLFCSFLSRFCTTTTLKCLFSLFMEEINKQRLTFISLFELRDTR